MKAISSTRQQLLSNINRSKKKKRQCGLQMTLLLNGAQTLWQPILLDQ